jgi:tape measure domain-containing protein
MATSETARQIQQARAELRRLNKEMEAFAQHAQAAGNQGGKGFKKRFLAATGEVFKEFAKGAATQLGASLVQKFFEKGQQVGKSFGRAFKRSAKKELDTASAELASGGGGGGGGGFGGLWKGVAISAAAVGLVAGKTLVGSIREAMDAEKLTISLEALQPGRGGDLFKTFRADALRTGMDIEDLAGNVRKFLALGFDEKGALKLNRAILDVSGGMGLTQEDANGLGLALAQIAAKGTASMEELRGQIAERGVPILQLLADKLTGGDQGALMKLVSQGKVAADVVIDAFSNLEGPLAKFAGGADRMGQSGAGLFGRLKQELKDLLRVGGESLLPEIKPLLEDAIGLVGRLKEDATAFGAQLAEGIGTVRAALNELSFGEIFQLAGLALKRAFLAALDVLARGAAAIFASFQRQDFLVGLEQRMKDAATIFKIEMLSAVEAVLRSMADDSPLGDRFAMAAGGVGRARIQAMMDQEDEAAAQARKGTAEYDPLGILKEEFAKAKSMFGLSAEDQAALDQLTARVEQRRGEDLAARTPTGGPVVTDSGSSGGGQQQKAAFDPRAMIGGGIANALSLIGGGGSAVILQKQVDLQEQMARNQAKTNEKLDKIVENTQPRTPRGPIATRPKFA